MKQPTHARLAAMAAKTPLTRPPASLYYVLHTTPGSFGERAQGHSERSGPCIFGGCR